MAASRTHYASDLASLISEYSSLYWAAGWMTDIEYEIWDRITRMRLGQEYLHEAWSATPLLHRIDRLQRKSDIWLLWDRDNPRHVLIDDRPLVIMSTEEWLCHLMEKAL